MVRKLGIHAFLDFTAVLGERVRFSQFGDLNSRAPSEPFKPDSPLAREGRIDEQACIDLKSSELNPIVGKNAG